MLQLSLKSVVVCGCAALSLNELCGLLLLLSCGCVCMTTRTDDLGGFDAQAYSKIDPVIRKWSNNGTIKAGLFLLKNIIGWEIEVILRLLIEELLVYKFLESTMIFLSIYLQSNLILIALKDFFFVNFASK